MRPTVHRSTTHNSQNLGATEMALDRRMNKATCGAIMPPSMTQPEKEPICISCVRCMNAEPLIQSEIRQKEKNKHIYNS